MVLVVVREKTLQSNPQAKFSGASTSHPTTGDKQLRAHLATKMIQRRGNSGVQKPHQVHPRTRPMMEI